MTRWLQVKTIGDAYVCCAGAFGDGDDGGAFGDAGGPAADMAPVLEAAGPAVGLAWLAAWLVFALSLTYVSCF